MKPENCNIYIIPNKLDLNNNKQIGILESDRNTVNINKIVNGYSIIYRENEFESFDINKFNPVIIKIISEYFKDTKIRLLIKHFPNLININDNYISNLIDFNELCKNNTNDKNKIEYRKSDTIFLIEKYLNHVTDDEYVANVFNDIDIQDPEKSKNILDVFMKGMGIGFKDDDEEYEEEDRKNDIKYHCERSMIFKRAKHKKTSIKKHGVIIYDTKRSINNDIDTLKHVLKSFIPGNEKWIKEFRNDILKRWIKSYAISKNNLKKLEKEHRKNMLKEKSSSVGSSIAEFTKRLFSNNDNKWNDPNR